MCYIVGEKSFRSFKPKILKLFSFYIKKINKYLVYLRK